MSSFYHKFVIKVITNFSASKRVSLDGNSGYVIPPPVHDSGDLTPLNFIPGSSFFSRFADRWWF